MVSGNPLIPQSAFRNPHSEIRNNQSSTPLIFATRITSLSP